MEDYIYTILVIAWIIYGVYKATSKNEKKTSSSKKSAHIYSEVEEEHTNEKTTGLEELFDGIFPSMKTENDIIQTLNKPFDAKKNLKKTEMTSENKPNEVLDSYDGSDHYQSVFNKNKDRDIPVSNHKESIDNQTENIEQEEYNKQVDLRQAIIYQAILERPY